MNTDKILNLKLYYKSKTLDNARQERDIKNKFIIGSNKHLHWQILDSNFPDKHKLVKKTKDKFKLVLRKGMKLTNVSYGSQELDEQALRSKNLLKGNELILDKEMSGKIEFAGNWAIAFEYIKPFRKTITPEDKRLIKQYQKFPELTSQQKLARNLFFISILLLLIFGFLFERYYTPHVVERTLAQRVTVDVTPVSPPLEFDVEPTPPPEEEVAEEAPRDIASILGFDPDVTGAGVGVPEGDIQLITYGEQIVAPGEGAAPGEGRGPAAPGVGRGRSSFDASETGPRIPPGTLLSGDINAERLGLRDVDESILAGQTDIEVTHISSSAQLAALAQARQRAASAGLQPVAEEAIEEEEPEVRATMANIRQYVDVYWRQVEELFNEERQKRDMYGSLVVTLYFAPDGNVEAADIQPRPGSFFTDSFVARARELMMAWRIPAREQMQPYQFTRRFIRN